LETDKQVLYLLLSHPRKLAKIGRWVVRISALKVKVRHIRVYHKVVADTLFLMFDQPPEETAAPVIRKFKLTSFPLAFQDLGKLQI
jgi:hypothetical protein